MYSWRANPFVRLLPPFAVGIVCAEYLPFLPTTVGAVSLLVVAASALWLARYPLGYRWRWTFGCVLLLLLLQLGFWAGKCDDELRLAGHFSKSGQTNSYWTGVITDAPVPGKSLKTPVRIISGGVAPSDHQRLTGNAMLFIRRSELVDSLRYGDTIFFRSVLRPAPKPQNPHAFDYSRYLHFKDIHHIGFVRTDSVCLLGRGGGLLLWRIAYGQRKQLLDILERYFPDAASHAVASALLVGYKEDLPEELETAYIATGSMHALAVSGSHVAFVYAGLFMLFRQLRLRGRWRQWIETTGVLAGVWAFTFLTGASASVLRAAWMFSLYIIGKAAYRQTSVWNTLAASAFVLLCIDPDYLFDAGFQLSYTAVVGMVLYYPKLYRLVPALPKWLNGAVQIFLVGVAAQLGTLPLSLYYFHQFPVYFWLAGWVVVLGGAVFLWGGAVLVLLDQCWPWAAAIVGNLLYHLTWVMNTSVSFISHLPGSLVEGIWFPGWVALGLYLIMAMITIALIRKKPPLLRWALLMLALTAVLRFQRELHRLDQRSVTIYQSGKSNLLDVIDGRQRYTLKDSIPERQERFAAQSNRWALGVRRSMLISPDSGFADDRIEWHPPVLHINNRYLIRIDRNTDMGAVAGFLEKRSKPDNALYCWIVEPPGIPMDSIMTRLKPDVAIIGNSIPWKTADRWSKQCHHLGVPAHVIARDGAWTIEMKP